MSLVSKCPICGKSIDVSDNIIEIKVLPTGDNKTPRYAHKKCKDRIVNELKYFVLH